MLFQEKFALKGRANVDLEIHVKVGLQACTVTQSKENVDAHHL